MAGRVGTYIEKYKGRSDRITCVRPRNDKVVHGFLEAVDEEGFLGALETSGEDKWMDLAIMLTDPKHGNKTFPTICRRLGIGIRELTEFWRESQINQGMILSMNKMPMIMVQTAEDATRQPTYCDRCDGKKVIQDGVDADGEVVERDCPKCKGTGEVEAPADRHSRDIVYETAGLINKKVSAVAIQQNFGVGVEETTSEIGRLLDITSVKPPEGESE